MSHPSSTHLQPSDQERLTDSLYSMDYSAQVSRRSAIKAALALAGAAVLFGKPKLARAVEATKETTEALKSAQSQLDAAQKELDAIGAQFKDMSIKQDKTLSQIEDVQGQIDNTQKKIDKKQKELEGKQQVLAGRVASTYKNGPSSTLALLLSSATFEELISNAYYVDKVNAQDKEAIEEVHRVQEELSKQKTELEQQKADLETLKNQQAEQLKQMQAKQGEAQDLLNGLSEDVRKLMAKRDAEVLAAAQEAERQRKAAEEAAKKAQASSTNTTNGNTSTNSNNGSSSNVTPGTPSSSVSGGQQRVLNACYSTPSPGQGYCAMWVSQVFSRAGFPYPGGNANDMYNAWCTSSNKSALQVGMIVAVSTHSHDSAGAIWGHVGIYVGNNTVMENIGGIASTNLDTWISYYGTTVTPRWGWMGGWVLS